MRIGQRINGVSDKHRVLNVDKLKTGNVKTIMYASLYYHRGHYVKPKMSTKLEVSEQCNMRVLGLFAKTPNSISLLSFSLILSFFCYPAVARPTQFEWQR